MVNATAMYNVIAMSNHSESLYFVHINIFTTDVFMLNRFSYSGTSRARIFARYYNNVHCEKCFYTFNEVQ